MKLNYVCFFHIGFQEVAKIKHCEQPMAKDAFFPNQNTVSLQSDMIQVVQISFLQNLKTKLDVSDWNCLKEQNQNCTGMLMYMFPW